MAIYNKDLGEVYNFQIRRGWPSDGALDELLTPNDPKTASVLPGSVVMMEADGTVKLADFAAASTANAAKAAYFVIDFDQTTDRLTGLKSNFIVDTSNIDATATYAINDTVTVKGGAFAKAATGDRVIGKVSKVDSVNKVIRVIWTCLD